MCLLSRGKKQFARKKELWARSGKAQRARYINERQETSSQKLEAKGIGQLAWDKARNYKAKKGKPK